MAEYAKLNAAKPDKHPGEQIMALDTVGRKEGFVLHSYEVDREKPKTLLKNTSLSNYQFVDLVDQLKREMGKLRPKGTDGSAVIPIDHAFDIKGIGMVMVLGVVKEGTVRAYDELALAPGGKKILVKSIQDA
jgi:selenocysteine-specific translation elongation factor